jgi:hypothetical protein
MVGPLARILLRYGAMALIMHGFMSADVGNSIASDPDLQMLLGSALVAIAVGFYFLAHKLNWRK